jgi:hypothetical protein
MKKHGSILVPLIILASSVEAAAPMDEQHARIKAINILMGDPFGATSAQVSKTIKEVQLIQNGKTACGTNKNPIWQFHVVVPRPVNNPETPIDGYLSLDATTGKLICANLPMLD